MMRIDDGAQCIIMATKHRHLVLGVCPTWVRLRQTWVLCSFHSLMTPHFSWSPFLTWERFSFPIFSQTHKSLSPSLSVRDTRKHLVREPPLYRSIVDCTSFFPLISSLLFSFSSASLLSLSPLLPQFSLLMLQKYAATPPFIMLPSFCLFLYTFSFSVFASPWKWKLLSKNGFFLKLF